MQVSSQQQNQQGVLGKSIESGKWMTIGFILEKSLGLISFFILARILTPADFGILAFVLLLPKFLQSTTETGFSAAVVQRQQTIDKYLNPIWTIGIVKSLIIAAITFVAGPYIAKFFNVEHAAMAIQLGGFFILIYSFSNIGQVYFFKNLDFKKIFIRNLSRQIAYITFTLLALLLTKSYWALVIGMFAQYLAETISTYILHPYRPKLSFQFKKLTGLFDFSKWIIGQGWLAQANTFIENSIVGKLLGAGAMGLYTKAKNIASIAPGLLSSIITRVGFPAYAQIKDKPEKIREGLLKSFDLLFFFVIPISFLAVAAGGKLILIVLGKQWLPMADTFRIALFFFIFNHLTEIAYSLLNGIGRPDKKVKYELFRIPLTLVLIAVLTPRFGMEGAAVSLLLGSLPTALLILRSLMKLTLVTCRDIIGTIIIPITISIILFIPVSLYKDYILMKGTPVFLFVVALLGILYLASIYIIDKRWRRGPYKTIKLILNNIK